MDTKELILLLLGRIETLSGDKCSLEMENKKLKSKIFLFDEYFRKEAEKNNV